MNKLEALIIGGIAGAILYEGYKRFKRLEGKFIGIESATNWCEREIERIKDQEE